MTYLSSVSQSCLVFICYDVYIFGRCATHDCVIVCETLTNMLLVSTIYFSCTLFCIIGPTGYSMNDHIHFIRVGPNRVRGVAMFM